MLVNYLVLHHTADSPDVTMEQERSAHIRSGQFKDIAYNGFIEKDGTFKVARDPVTTKYDQNAANEGLNHESLSIATAGNFEKYPPNEDQLHTVIQVCTAWCRKYKLDSSKIIGHYEVAKLINNPKVATACPGKYFIQEIPNIRKAVQAYLDKDKKGA